LETALLTYSEPGPAPSLATIGRLLDAARRDYHGTRYSQLSNRLSPLLAASQAAALHATGPAAQTAHTLHARALGVAAHLAVKCDLDGLAWVAADRAMTAAHAAGDPIVIAEATRMLCIVARRGGHHQRAQTLAVNAAASLNPYLSRDPNAAALHAALLSTAGYTAARAGDHDTATALLAEAAGRAQADTGGGLALVHVTIYQVSASLAVGDPAAALQHARNVHSDRHLSPERRGRLLVDVALAYDQHGQPARAVHALRAAEAAAPEEVRARPVVRTLTERLLRHPGPTPGGLRSFATRIAAPL